jgi:hypothetical protein
MWLAPLCQPHSPNPLPCSGARSTLIAAHSMHAIPRTPAAGALLHRMLPRGTAARSMLKLRAASTSTATATETQQDLSYVVDRDWSGEFIIIMRLHVPCVPSEDTHTRTRTPITITAEPVSPAATGGATSLRLLPINRAPETRFTVCSD